MTKVAPHTGLLWLFLSQPTGGADGYGVLRKPWSDSVSAVRDEAELPIAAAIGNESLGARGGRGGVCLFLVSRIQMLTKDLKLYRVPDTQIGEAIKISVWTTTATFILRLCLQTTSC